MKLTTSITDNITLPVRILHDFAEHGLRKTELCARVDHSVELFIRRTAPVVTGPRSSSVRQIWLLHGAGMDSLGFDIPLPGWSLMENLAQRGHEVFACDYRGHGRSTRVSDGASVTPLVVRDDVVAAISLLSRGRTRTKDSEEQIDEVHLVGVSFGSVVAPLVAKRLNGHVGSITLLGAVFASLGGMTAGFPEFIAALSSSPGGYAFTTEEEWGEQFLHDADPRVLRWHEVSYGPAYAYPIGPYLAVASLPVDSELSTISCPVNIVIGDNDPFATVDDMSTLLSRVSSDRTRLTIQRGIGHLPYVEAQAEQVLSLIEDAVSGTI